MKHFLLSSVLCLSLVSTAQAAEVFIEVGVGPSLMQRTTADGIWWQSPFPHHFDLTSLAYKAGLGVQLTEQWSLTASYVTLGTAKAVTEYVSDDDYDHGRRDGSRKHLTAYDNYQGGQLVGRYRWTLGPVQPFLQGGVAVMLHHVVANRTTEFEGVIPMVTAGGGVCYWWVCGEVNYYRGVQAPQYPISTSAVVPMLSVRVPLP